VQLPLFIFRCNSKYNRYGFTLDETGEKLPAMDCNGWSFLVELPLVKDGIAIMGVPANDILKALHTHAYYILEP
jgi:hypothetical protein